MLFKVWCGRTWTGLRRELTSTPSNIFGMKWNGNCEPGLIARDQCLTSVCSCVWMGEIADRFQILCICWLSKYKFLMEEGEETNALSAETEIDITSSLVWSADISIRVRKAKAGNITCLMSLTSSCHTHYSWKCSSQINIYGDHFA